MVDAPKPFVIGPVRLAFPEIWEPKAVNEGDDPKYSCTLLLPPEFDRSAIAQALQQAAVHKWGQKIPPQVPQRNPIQDCELKAQYNGYLPGWKFANVRSGFQITVVDEKVAPVLDRSLIYPGCWVNVQVSAFASHHPKGGPRVSLGFNMIQFVKHDDRLDNRQAASEVFTPVEVDESELAQQRAAETAQAQAQSAVAASQPVQPGAATADGESMFG